MGQVLEITGPAVGDPQRLAGKYLTFILGEETHGLQIRAVQEIIGNIQVTHVPRTPSHVCGVSNLRGKVIPIVDLRIQFGMQALADANTPCVIVVQITEDREESTVGLMVDEVSEVVDIRPDQIESPPPLTTCSGAAFILGMAKIRERVVMLLDANRVLSRHEISELEAIV